MKTAKGYPRNLIGDRVKIVREKHNPRITQDDLSARLIVKGVDLSRSSIAKIESKVRPVTDIQLLAIADALKVEVTWLLGIHD
jgi:transcriptional regulator with XRE-family HTH domain